ncbi:26S proteasome regulatory subunit 7-like [Hondaea fermentalgiana]|uniref:26S proteasome regulatory subunit 7-like n=1 Tax=Hondaea fermentalgiana TaxID=2315210 RepID=A0A2R5GC99_9STRA|nr:26S proteasome regulatory subunit 7-like [Hondaea fermentalgiana]|eukprot:GBG25374.1 26S proteasome regulatory subunit 7-like [Hondaea fermentalgiana]
MARKALWATAIVAACVVAGAASLETLEGRHAASSTSTASWSDVLVSDERLKTNVTKADTATLLDAVSRVQLREFDYVYEQFYNPIFGKRQLGIIAQEIKPLLPGSVGVIPKRSVSHVDDKDPTILTNVHVFHSENLFMAHIGATQELIQRTQTARKTLEDVQDSLERLAQDATSGKEAHAALSSMRTKQDELENLAKAAHERSEGAIRLEHVLKSLEDTSRKEQAERTALTRRVQDLHEDLRTEVRDQATLHRDVSSEMSVLTEGLKQLGARIDENLVQVQAAQTKASENIAQVSREASEIARKQVEEARTKIDAKLADSARDMAASLENVEKKLASERKDAAAAVSALEKSVAGLKAQIEANVANVDILSREVGSLQSSLGAVAADAARNLSEARGEISHAFEQASSELDELRTRIDDLETTINAQAGAELIERRKIAEAEARTEEAKIELERTRTVEEEKRARSLAAIEVERLERQENATLARVEKEEEARAARELKVAIAQEEAARREFERRADHESSLVRAQADAEVSKIRAQSELERVRVLAQGEADAQQERANHELRKEMAALESQSARENTVAAIQATFQETIAAMRMASQSPQDVAGALGLFVLLAFGVYAGREFVIYWRKVFEHRLGQPSLVRETSQRGWLPLAYLVEAVKTATKRTRALGMRMWSRQLGRGKDTDAASTCKKASISSSSSSSSSSSGKAASSPPGRPGARSSGQPTGEDSFVSFMTDVVLPPSQAKQIERVARATRAAHVNGTPLRHLLFYGPPGTGKTMVARRLSKWCGLDYAIMSGADVAPLKDRAVTELHQLFEWAKRTPRGVALFIDEADAFLATRDGGSISESLRNALTALLYHTGAPSCRIMLILATNRPHDLDSAVLDRVDESVHFDLPSLGERRRIVRQYFAQTLVASLDVPPEFAQEEALERTAELTDGFSGREIAKLMTSVQAHVFGSAVVQDDNVGEPRRVKLSRAIYDQVLGHTVKEHAAKAPVLEKLSKAMSK